MSGHYHSSLVALSVAIAVIASYTALDLAGRVGDNRSCVVGLAVQVSIDPAIAGLPRQGLRALRMRPCNR
ncbi:MAG: hypothetical protein QOI59_4423 [Gammaproteobacteria bacterium]|jgi:NO-binding membrane sensor protein with MHYT domain|nr:hypothetical protein [Gammaproteobacteria bacterium]